jgi:ACR3 family arsenite efflux pump ArsB
MSIHVPWVYAGLVPLFAIQGKAISLFGFQSCAVLATVVGVLIEVPVMDDSLRGQFQ